MAVGAGAELGRFDDDIARILEFRQKQLFRAVGVVAGTALHRGSVGDRVVRIQRLNHGGVALDVLVELGPFVGVALRAAGIDVAGAAGDVVVVVDRIGSYNFV